MVKIDKDDINILELYLVWIGGCLSFLLFLEVMTFFFGGK